MDERQKMKISEILKNAETGSLCGCNGCPWSPVNDSGGGFGVSCRVHGVDWVNTSKVNSFYIAEDPANTTPHKTGRLCAVDNAVNASDYTAQHHLRLWNATVSMQDDTPDAGGYLKQNYWTNAIMHGAAKNTNNRKYKKEAQEHCTKILALQLEALNPNVIIASGETAVNSLHKIGLINYKWSDINYRFAEGAYQEDIKQWRNMNDLTVFCTYHTSKGVVNRTLSRPNRYDSIKTEALIQKKLEKLDDKASVEQFLLFYGNPEKDATARGMRYLLNHWLDMGPVIRSYL